ncbi:MAG: hypothetical protein HOE92_06575 [Euryarchaeota archaeon]|jgi:KaiC/GvpD/RAD55 family RecA-like ATPase|nr:hypothetical protein [Euryarchaeota archaeon]MBT3971865.1 hypothetical protein [Euryarchaeota archaeon]MBT4408162.1 hypothetical protein [Euryarchaeota archaeon]MBT6645741.1 hypothetical protein [Euryarchaeota archaeon]
MAKKDIQFSLEDEEFFGVMGSVGVPKFDREMRGGIPRGFMILAVVATGSGAELFAKQFVSPAEEPENTLYVSTSESAPQILNVFNKYNWPTDINVRTMGEEYNSRVLERDLQAARYRLQGFSMADVQRLAQTRFVDDETEDFLTELTDDITSLGPYFRAVIDSMDFYFNREDPARVMSMLRMMQAHTQLNRGLLLCLVSESSLTKSMEMELGMLADMILKFEVVMVGTDFETRMVIKKFRNAPENMAVISFKVTPEEGITPETVKRIA